jgi:hypothetical protein
VYLAKHRSRFGAIRILGRSLEIRELDRVIPPVEVLSSFVTTGLGFDHRGHTVMQQIVNDQHTLLDPELREICDAHANHTDVNSAC